MRHKLLTASPEAYEKLNKVSEHFTKELGFSTPVSVLLTEIILELFSGDYEQFFVKLKRKMRERKKSQLLKRFMSRHSGGHLFNERNIIK